MKKGLYMFMAVLLTWGVSCHRQTPTENAEESMGEFTDEVSEVVEDEERARQISALLSEFMELSRRHIEREQDLQRRLVDLNADYQSTRQQFEDLLSDRRANRRQNLSRLLEIRGEFLQLTSEEEWEALERRRIDAVETIIAALAPSQALARDDDDDDDDPSETSSEEVVDQPAETPAENEGKKCSRY